MMQPDTAKDLRDMLDSAGAIERYVGGKTLDEFLKEKPLQDAINWNFCVVGEALSQLSRLDEATAMQITEYARIIGFRNQLLHGYGVINNRITWNIIETKLPILLRELRAMLGE